MSSEGAEDLLHDSVIELFDLSDYSSTLPNEAKERYVAKLNEVQCDCPYVIENEYWTSSTQELETILPSVEFGDVWNYLVKVQHSMAFSLPPLRPWVAFNPAGGVITAHCDCIAGYRPTNEMVKEVSEAGCGYYF
uniref:Uncharacterized protein n=1 Tax=Daphnia galeata TaxID=27404 RepID=A0A8J2RT73_9CRUS|nr:unnamed protein product [Daphnia galeata]